MLVFSAAKINLGLRITEKRTDGFHSIDSIFFPVPFRDAVEVISDKHLKKGECSFQFRGDIPGAEKGNNLCEKAYHLLASDFELPGTGIYLQKNIPTGAGLGGGSGNAAAVLLALNDLYQLQLTTQQLFSYAMQLGSDCGFFIYNKPCYVQGRGEIISPVELSLKNYSLVIIYPDIHVSTAQAYAGITPGAVAVTTRQIVLENPVDLWKNELVNDFEKVIFSLHPEIAAIKKELYSLGATYAGMSGSGSAVFAIFGNGNEQVANAIEKFKKYRTFKCTLT